MESFVRPVAVVVAAIVLATSGSAAGPEQTFSARTDLVVLDVSVSDRNRNAVMGLQLEDFEVLEEGQRRPIEFVREINLEPAPSSRPLFDASLNREVMADPVATNQVDAKRVVVLAIDDFSLRNSGSSGMWPILATRQIAHKVVSELGPEDLVGVVYAQDRRNRVGITADRAMVRRAIDSGRLFPSGTPDAEQATAGSEGDPLAEALAEVEPVDCACGMCSIRMLGDIADALGSITNLRKTVVYIGTGPSPPMTVPPGLCYQTQMKGLTEAFRSAQQAHVSIDTFDPRGLESGMTMARVRIPRAFPDWRTEFVKTVAETTGGQAIVDTNDPDLRVAEVLAGSRSYYLIGFRPAEVPAGTRPRRVEVRVNRPRTMVRSRSSFVSPSAEPTDAGGTPASRRLPLERVTNALVPAGQVSLRTAATAFLGDDGVPFIVLTVGLDPADVPRPTERIRILARAIDNGGRVAGRTERSIELPPTFRPDERSFRMTLSVPPGSYEVRLGAELSDGTMGSVYTSIVVPNFATESLSASGLLFAALAAPIPTSPTASSPMQPTTVRAFASNDRARALVRIYRGHRRDLASGSSVEMTSRILDATNSVVTTDTRTLRFAGGERVEHQDYGLDLPLGTLPPGDYLLMVEAVAGRDRLTRAGTFQVR